MRRRLIWMGIVVPASLYLLFFFNEALKSFGIWPMSTPGPDGEPRYTWFGTWTLGLEHIEVVVSRAVSILVVMAIGLGAINLFHHHGKTLSKRGTGWPASLIVFISFAVVGGLLMWQYTVIDPQRQQVVEATESAWQKLADAQQAPTPDERDKQLALLTEAEWEDIRARQAFLDAYRFDPRAFVVDYINTPLVATVMALLGFYITYAAYRAFRIRTLEATVMMLSAAVVILGSDPVGGWISSGTLTKMADFDNTVLNSGMQRGLWLGIHVATIVVCLRIFLGYERGIVDAQEQ